MGWLFGDLNRDIATQPQNFCRLLEPRLHVAAFTGVLLLLWVDDFHLQGVLEAFVNSIEALLAHGAFNSVDLLCHLSKPWAQVVIAFEYALEAHHSVKVDRL